MKIKDEFKNLLIPLTSKEFEDLEKNIQEKGCREPIATWNDFIIDGHNRYTICKKHNIPFNTVAYEFANDEEAKIWIWKNQLGRRNLNDFLKIKISLQIQDALKNLAKAQQIRKPISVLMDSSKQNEEKPQMTFTESVNVPPTKPIHVRKEIAKTAKVSEDSVRKVEKILKEAPKEVIEAVQKNEKSINEAFKQLPSEMKKQEEKERKEKEKWEAEKEEEAKKIREEKEILQRIEDEKQQKELEEWRIQEGKKHQEALKNAEIGTLFDCDDCQICFDLDEERKCPKCGSINIKETNSKCAYTPTKIYKCPCGCRGRATVEIFLEEEINDGTQ